MSLCIYALGPFAVALEGVPLADEVWKTQKNKLLCKILLTFAGRALSREQLIEWLWTDLNPTAAERNLRVAISQLRRTLEPDLKGGRGSHYVWTTDNGYSWNAHSDYWLDAAEFERRVAAFDPYVSLDELERQMAGAEAARALYRGDYLEEDRYTDWATAQRERLQETYYTLLLRLAEARARGGNYAAASALCRDVLAVDRCRESVWVQLMLYYTYSGDQSRALQAYDECIRALAEELDLEPLPSTAALAEQIRRRQIEPSADYPAFDLQPPRHGMGSMVPVDMSGALPGGQPLPAPGPRHNLPQMLTPFIGREAELAHISGLLADPECRLLTLAGPGGIGKSRLAVQAARATMADFTHGTFLIALAPIGSPDALVSLVAGSVGLFFSGRQEPAEQLLSYLREKQLLLIMDGFEHILEAADLLVDLLQQAPQVKVLATSRERLNIRGEWFLEIQGLEFPAPGTVVPAEQYSAIRLFVEHANRAHVGFTLDESNTAAIARICRLVDGMPLGIELAASWVRVLSPQDIAREIANNIGFLATTLRDMPERHRSLVAVFEHSWNLLRDDERRVFCRMALFRAGFRREAGAHVAAATLPLLSALVDKSLLHKDGNDRYAMLDVLRQFAAEKLAAEAGEQAETAGRHAGYYARYLGQQEDALKGADQHAALRAIEADLENIRAAWQQAVATGRGDLLSNMLESLHLFYDIRSRFAEGEAAFDLAARRARVAGGLQHLTRDGQRSLLGKVLAYQGKFCLRLSRYDIARTLLQQALELFRAIDDPREIGLTLVILGTVVREEGDYAEARRLCDQGLALLQENGDRWDLANALNDVGIVAYRQGDYTEARRLWRQGLAIFRDLQNQRGLARSLNNLGVAAQVLGDYTEAQQVWQENQTAFLAIGDLRGLAMSSNNLGVLAYDLGDFLKARDLFADSLAIARETGDQWAIATYLINLAFANTSLKHYREARAQFRDGIASAMGIGATPVALYGIVGVGAILRGEGNPGRAAELFTFALTHPAGKKETQAKAHDLLVQVSAELERTALEAAAARGRSADFDTLVQALLVDL